MTQTEPVNLKDENKLFGSRACLDFEMIEFKVD